MQFEADNPLLIHYDPNNPRILQHILTDDVLRRDFPHQVIVQAYLCTGWRFNEQRRFCDMMGFDLSPQVRSTRINDVAYRIFAFAERRQAQVFAGRFDGIRFVMGRSDG